MTELNDQSLLIHWYRHRNAEAFRVLASRHGRMVYATALRILRNPHDAEDVSQQSFLALAQTRRPPSGNVAAWLHQTAYRAALNLARVRNRRTARDHAYTAAQPESTRTEWDDIRDLVDEAVATLPDACRECIVLYFFEEQTHAAIGERLGISRQAVAQRIEKGIALVRKRLASKGVVVPAGALLVALIYENAAVALPATLMTEMGRISLAATPSVWAVGATYASGAGFKVAAAMVIVSAAASALVTASMLNGKDTSVMPVATAAIQGAAIPAPSAAPAGTADRAPDTARAVAAADPEPRRVIVETGGTDPLRSASISGRLTGPGGKPLSEVTIQMFAQVRMSAFNLSGNSADPQTEALYRQDASMGMTFDAVTDSAGEFTASELFPGEYMFNLTWPDGSGGAAGGEFARFTLAAGEHKSGVELTYGLEGELTVSGIVSDSAGVPVSGARVTGVQPVTRFAVTDERGRFTISQLPEGVVAIQVMSSDEYANTSEATVVRAGTQDVKVILLRFASIQGRVVDAKTRQPVASFEEFTLPGHQIVTRREERGMRPNIEKPDGAFKIERVSPGDVTVGAQAAGYSPAGLHVTVAEGEHLRGVEIALERSEGAISGVVLDDEGRPVSGAAIYLGDVPAAPIRGNRLPTTTTGADGQFSIDIAPADLEFIGAGHPDFAPGGSEPGTQMKIVLKRAARVQVKVELGGQPVRDVRLYVTPWGPSSGERVSYTAARATTGPDGLATVEQVAPGTVCVQSRLPSRRSRLTFADIAPGEEKSLVIEFPPADATLEGVLTANGMPVKGSIRLFVDTATGREDYSSSTAEDGAFRIAEIASGLARLVVDTEGGRAIVEDVPLAAGEVTVLNVDVTVLARVRGAISGSRAEDDYVVEVFPGALDLEDIQENNQEYNVWQDSAGLTSIDAKGAYAVPLHKPGTYTVVLSSYPKGKFWRKTCHEARVVEVPESGELEVNFELTQ